MTNNVIGRPKAMSVIWPAGLLGSGGATGLWLGLAPGGVSGVLAAAALAVTAVFGAIWLFHDRAVRRLHATLDAYAEREIARQRPRQALPQGIARKTHRAGLVGK
jgi:hypothetical protein